MPAVGAEWSWPVLVIAGNTSHVIEPIVQVVGRPDEPYAGELPNDDAQSLVFDDSILFAATSSPASTGSRAARA